jgi:hypothetical protein
MPKLILNDTKIHAMKESEASIAEVIAGNCEVRFALVKLSEVRIYCYLSTSIVSQKARGQDRCSGTFTKTINACPSHF